MGTTTVTAVRSRISRALGALAVLLSAVVVVPSTATAQSANEEWLELAYAEILGRPADDAGLEWWLGRIAADGADSRTIVAREMAFSVEGARGEVVRAYADLLGRSPDDAGLAYWTDFLRSEPATVLRSLLLASEERQLRAGERAAWLDGVYQEILGRDADPAGRTYWFEQLDNGFAPLLLVLEIYVSTEGINRRVDQIYTETVGRSATPAEVDAGRPVVTVLGERELRARLLASDEAYERFLAIAALRRAALRAEATG